MTTDPYYVPAFDTAALQAENVELRARIASLETTVIALTAARVAGENV